jgi:hypothetical protein
MKQTLYILTFALSLLSCHNRTTESKADTRTTGNLQNVSTIKQVQNIYIKDKSQYDPTLIEGLSEYKDPIKLIDNYILIGKDTVYFPEDIQLSKNTIFKGTKDLKNFLLTITRTNLTSLNYNFQLFNKDTKLINSKSGKATLGALFFLGSETDEDDETGEEYLSFEYRDNSPDCSFAIRIGERDDNGKLRAKIILYCKDNKSKNIDLDDNPTLRTE